LLDYEGVTFGENLNVTFSGIAFGLRGPTSIVISPFLMFHKQFISERLKRLLQSARNEQVADSFARGFLEQRSTRRRTLRASLLGKD
jgi:hypothetical protein